MTITRKGTKPYLLIPDLHPPPDPSPLPPRNILTSTARACKHLKVQNDTDLVEFYINTVFLTAWEYTPVLCFCDERLRGEVQAQTLESVRGVECYNQWKSWDHILQGNNPHSDMLTLSPHLPLPLQNPKTPSAEQAYKRCIIMQDQQPRNNETREMM